MGAGEVLKDVWHREARTVTIRNAIRLRRWGMRVTVYDDPTPANNGDYVLSYNLNSTSRQDNDNWIKVASLGSTWGGAGSSAVIPLDAVIVNAGNVNAAETIVYAYTILPAILNANKKSISGKSFGTFAAGSDAYVIKAYLDGTAFFDSGNIQLFDETNWILEYTITRVNANSQKISTNLITGIGGNNFVSNEVLTKNLAANVDLQVTVQGVTTNQIVCTNSKLFLEGI